MCIRDSCLEVSTKVLNAGKSLAKIFIEPLLMLQSANADVPKNRNNKVTSIFLIYSLSVFCLLNYNLSMKTIPTP